MNKLIVSIIYLFCFSACAAQTTGAGTDALHVYNLNNVRPNVIIEPDGGDKVWVFAKNPHELGTGGEFHIYVDPVTHPEARGSFSKFALRPGGALPTHRHERTEEISYFLSGEGVVIFFEDGEPREVAVRAGHVWYAPPGAWHALRNTGDEPLTLIFTIIPNEEKGLLSFFRKIGAKPGEEAAVLSPEEFSRIASEHDLILGSPTE